MPLPSIPSSKIGSIRQADAGSLVKEGESAARLGLDFSRRAELVELMDCPCSYEDLRGCLHDIARVNRLVLAYRPTISWMEELVEAHPGLVSRLRVVDVGCGYGDMLRRIDSWAAGRGVRVELIGIDLNPDAIRAAKGATAAGQRIEWVVGDALSEAVAGDVDVVVSSLLTHHLTDARIVEFLRWMESTARYGWFVSDLHRQPVPYHLFRLMARVVKLHPFVKNDGPVSIRRSFQVGDWQRLCAAAGFAAGMVSVREFRPARLCVGRIK